MEHTLKKKQLDSAILHFASHFQAKTSKMSSHFQAPERTILVWRQARTYITGWTSNLVQRHRLVALSAKKNNP